MKVLFYRQGDASFLNSSGLKFSGGVASTSSSQLDHHKNVNNLTGNKGNMIHREAMPKILKINRDASAYVNLIKLRDACADENEYAKLVNESFDCLVISMANFIQPGEQETRLYDLLRPLEIDVHVVGVGLQIPCPFSQLAQSTQDLLKYFNDKAKLFSVRGKRTENWCHKNGLDNAIALGCPSMFVYPSNVFSITLPDLTKDLKIISAGHIHQAVLGTKKVNGRAFSLMSALKGMNVDYVFQSELFKFDELLTKPGVFNEALSEVSAKHVNEFIQDKSGIKPPFNRYFQFDSPAAWRSTSSTYDLYIGDRIHGAVAAMQSGTPALIVYDDIRVKELADYFCLPSVDVKELNSKSLNVLLEEQFTEEWLAKFKNRYKLVLRKFIRKLDSIGLKTAHFGDVKFVLSQDV